MHDLTKLQRPANRRALVLLLLIHALLKQASQLFPCIRYEEIDYEAERRKVNDQHKDEDDHLMGVQWVLHQVRFPFLPKPSKQKE